MSSYTTMVLVDTFQEMDESDLTKENYRKAVDTLIETYQEDFEGLMRGRIVDTGDEYYSEAVIGYLEPGRLISQVVKYHDNNIQCAKESLVAANSSLKKYNTSVSCLFDIENFENVPKLEYIDAMFKLAECVDRLAGREASELDFYDLTDSSLRLSDAQLKSIFENPEIYSLIPITLHN